MPVLSASVVSKTTEKRKSLVCLMSYLPESKDPE